VSRKSWRLLKKNWHLSPSIRVTFFLPNTHWGNFFSQPIDTCNIDAVWSLVAEFHVERNLSALDPTPTTLPSISPPPLPTDRLCQLAPLLDCRREYELQSNLFSMVSLCHGLMPRHMRRIPIWKAHKLCLNAKLKNIWQNTWGMFLGF
jgi:hypothetical protein